MSTARFLVAKYAPDVARLEPRNIGIILWVDGLVGSRFVGSDDVDFIDDPDTYERWVNFWQGQCTKDSIDLRGKPPVTRSSVGFLDALRMTQKGNYLLYDAGRLHKDVAPSEIEDATAFLFRELVSGGRHPKEAKDDEFTSEVNELLDEAGYTSQPDWKGAAEVPCVIEGVEQPFKFNFVLGNGKPRIVGQRVPVNRPQSVNSAAFMLEWVGRTRKVAAKRRRFAAIDSRASKGDSGHAALLSRFATVVDLANKNKARDLLAAALH
jgi:hypothetical protein